MNTWQPIETAPKNAEAILVADFDTWARAIRDGYGWSEYIISKKHGNFFEELSFEPTHWMPCPPPPVFIPEDVK